MLRQLVRLSPEDRALLVKAVCLVAVIRVGLWLLPFRIVRGAVERASRTASTSAARRRHSEEDVVWAVTAASRRIPGASCLTQALASSVLLHRHGFPVLLRIGVAQEPDGKVAAHAWVETNGRVVIGGRNSPRRFTTLSPPDP